MQGVISKVFSRPTQWGPMFSFQINGSKDYFGTGKVPPPEAGTTVQFDEQVNDKGYKEAKNIKAVQAQPVQQGVNVAGIQIPQAPQQDSPAKQRYWQNKEENDLAKQKVIELQSCRNSAIELVKLLITPSANGEVGLKLPAQAKREEFLVALVTKYTQDFLQSNSSLTPGDNKNDDQSSESAPVVPGDDAPWQV